MLGFGWKGNASSWAPENFIFSFYSEPCTRFSKVDIFRLQVNIIAFKIFFLPDSPSDQ